MILSHHPPCQFDRTYKIFGIRICSRCLGVFCGFILTLGIFHYVDSNQLSIFFLGYLLSLPAIVTFLIHELRYARITNFFRMITGSGLGYTLAVIMTFLFDGHCFNGILLLFYLLLLEIIVAFILNKKKRLIPFIKEYEDAVL